MHRPVAKDRPCFSPEFQLLFKSGSPYCLSVFTMFCISPKISVYTSKTKYHYFTKNGLIFFKVKYNNFTVLSSKLNSVVKII